MLLSGVEDCYFKKVICILKLNRNEFRYNFFFLVLVFGGDIACFFFKKNRF